MKKEVRKMGNSGEIKDLLKQVITAQESICKTLSEIVGVEDGSKPKECFTDDEIFLLSEEEYKKYKDLIPEINCWWWLRSPGEYPGSIAYVCSNGAVDNCDDNVFYQTLNNIFDGYGAIRPALHLNPKSCLIGKRIIRYNFPWIVLDSHTAIAEVPIAFRKFDKESNDYENSEIRKFLLDWKKERINSEREFVIG